MQLYKFKLNLYQNDLFVFCFVIFFVVQRLRIKNEFFALNDALIISGKNIRQLHYFGKWVACSILKISTIFPIFLASKTYFCQKNLITFLFCHYPKINF